MYKQPDSSNRDSNEKILQINRVSKKTKGGSNISFSALVVYGDKKGKVGIGLGKAKDVSSAVRKASTYAQNHMVDVRTKGTTIPHEIKVKFGAARILMKPAPPGTGVIAGSTVRAV